MCINKNEFLQSNFRKLEMLTNDHAKSLWFILLIFMYYVHYYMPSVCLIREWENYKTNLKKF